jgi:hypothetical protein
MGRTPIIALTASAFDHDRQEILAAGCDDTLTKPYRESVLFDKLAEHLDVELAYQDGSPPVSSQSSPPPTGGLRGVGERRDPDQRDPDAPPDAPPVLDAERLNHLRELEDPTEHAVLDRLITLYLENCTAQLGDLRRAVAEHDTGEVERIAHTLKGSSANLGAVAVAEVCQQLELSGREGRFDEDGGAELLSELLTRLITGLERATTALEGERRGE